MYKQLFQSRSFIIRVQFNVKHSLFTPQNVPLSHSTLAASDVSRRKWLIPGAEYSIFTGQPLDAQDRKMDSPLEDTCVPG